MSGISTSRPVALIEAKGGMDIEIYKSVLDCVLHMVNNGRLGGGGWGSAGHKAAIAQVKAKITEVEAGFVEQDEEEARYAASNPSPTGGTQ